MQDVLTLRFWIHQRAWLAGCVLVLALFSNVCQASQVDWGPWQRVPVLDHGRRMPLDTFARYVVRDITGRENPKLYPPGDVKALDPQARATVERLFTNNQLRKFTAAELLYCWTIEPEAWEQIPVLSLSNESLRKKLGAPIYGPTGGRLKHISVDDFEAHLADIQDLRENMAQRQREAKQRQQQFQPTREDEAILQLIRAYNLYRSIVFLPNQQNRISHQFQSEYLTIDRTWQKILPHLQPWLQLNPKDNAFSLAIRQTNDAIEELAWLIRAPKVETVQLADAASKLADTANRLVTEVEKNRKKIFDTKTSDQEKDSLEKVRAILNRLAVETNRLANSARLLALSLYDEGDRSIRVVPTLNRLTLLKERDPKTAPSPWLNLQTILYAPKSVLKEMPQEKVTAVREAFEAARQDYLKLGREDDSIESLNTSLEKFTKQLRSLGETMTEQRAKLDQQGLDQSLLTQTTYPPAGTFETELNYNRVDPFLWAWILTVAAIVFFALAWGFARTPMFTVGLLLLVLGQVATCYGLSLRMMITKMVPVTNMYETILFVGATVGILTIFVGIYPILQAGLTTAWRLTAWPVSAEARSMTDEQLCLAGPLASHMMRWFWFGIRVGLAVGVVYVLAIGSFSPDGEKSVLGLIPRIPGQSIDSFKDILPWLGKLVTANAGIGTTLGAVVLWLVGLAILAWAVWFIPRALPTLLMALVLVPVSWRQLGLRDRLPETLQRRSYLITGALVALLLYLVGYFTPQSVFNRDVDSGMQPILRNNFWLAIHVLIITASYGAGALAWGIGNVATACYLFGRYEDGKPKAAHLLAKYVYRMMQIAVLLLAAGTITGAIWADFAWGRYWGWDPKEVWALITLLVYLAILHGRWARWIGDFGMAVGSVFGFTSIIIAWYGVNLLNSGLHSYGNLSGNGFLYIMI
ncbi:MAG: cytochrome c biogenesis protein CcsA, partial [Planctomycetia bacterium]